MNGIDNKILAKHLSRALLERDVFYNKLNDRSQKTLNKQMKLYDEEFIDRLVHERNELERQLKDANDLISKLTKF